MLNAYIYICVHILDLIRERERGGGGRKRFIIIYKYYFLIDISEFLIKIIMLCADHYENYY